MIWFFLGGMVAGAAGVVMYANWWVEKHTKKVVVEYIDSIEKRMDEAIKNAQEKEKEDKTHE